MEENQKRNQQREARVKLDKTRKHLHKVEKEQKQMLKNKYVMSEIEMREYKAANNRLTFGLKFWATYKGHETQEINNILYNPNTKAFVTWNEKFIHVWNPHTNQRIYHVDFFTETKSHAITTLSYSTSNHLYFAMSTDFKAYIFNENLILIRSLSLGMRLILRSRFVESSNTLVGSGVEGIFFYRLTYTGATDKQQAHKLDPLGTKIGLNLKLFKRLDGVDSWVKNIQIDSEMNLLFGWSLEQTSVYQLSDGKLHFTFDNILKASEDLIQDLLYMPKYRYIIMCSQQAKLIVYKWAAQAQVVTEFKENTRPIKALLRHPNRLNQFISAALDQTIRIWCLEKFTCQYVLKIPFEFKNIALIPQMSFACFEKEQIRIGKLSDIVYLAHKSQTNVLSVGHCYEDFERQRDHRPYAIFSQFKDNSIKLLAPTASADVRVKSTIYPPPNAVDIQQVRFCQILKQIILLVKTGILYFYRLEQGTAVMVRQILPTDLRDFDGKVHNQTLTTFEVGFLEPDRFDVQNPSQNQGNLKRMATVYEKTANNTRAEMEGSQYSDSTSLLETDPEEREAIPEDMYLILGYHRGQVITYNVYKCDVPIARHEVCRNKVLMIREVLTMKMFVVFDDAHMIYLVRMNSSGCQHFHKVNLFRSLLNLVVRDNYVYLAFLSGDLEFFEVRDISQLKKEAIQRRVTTFANNLNDLEMQKVRKGQIKGQSIAFVRYDMGMADEHEDQLTAITACPKQGTIATADITGLVKIWTMQKQLIRELKFPEAVNTLCFIDARGDLLLGHGTAQSLVYARQYVNNDVRQFTDDELLFKSQEVSNDRMYQLYSKDTALQTKEEKLRAKEKLLAGADFASGSSDEEDVNEIERLMLAEKIQSAKIVKEKAQMNKLRKVKTEAKRVEVQKKIDNGRSYDIEEAAGHSQVLAIQAIAEDKRQRLQNEQAVQMKQKLKQMNKISQMVGLNKRTFNDKTDVSEVATLVSERMTKNLSGPAIPNQMFAANDKQTSEVGGAQLKQLKLPKVAHTGKDESLVSSNNPSSSPTKRPKVVKRKVLTVPNDLPSKQQVAQGSSTNLQDIAKFGALPPALPQEVIQDKFNMIAEGRLHPKLPGQSIRRQLTEHRIATNIQIYNSAVSQENMTGLYIGTQYGPNTSINFGSSQLGSNNKHDQSTSQLSDILPSHQQSKMFLQQRGRERNQSIDQIRFAASKTGGKYKYQTQELQKIHKSSPHRRLISELRHRKNGRLSKNISKLQLHRKGQSQNQLPGVAQNFSVDDNSHNLVWKDNRSNNAGYLFDAYKNTLSNPYNRQRLSVNIDSIESSLFDPRSSMDPYQERSIFKLSERKLDSQLKDESTQEQSGSVVMLSNIGMESQSMLKMDTSVQRSSEMGEIEIALESQQTKQSRKPRPFKRPPALNKRRDSTKAPNDYFNEDSGVISCNSPLKITASNLFDKTKQPVVSTAGRTISEKAIIDLNVFGSTFINQMESAYDDQHVTSVLKQTDVTRVVMDTKNSDRNGLEDQMDTMKASIYDTSSQAGSDKKINLVVKDRSPYKDDNKLAGGDDTKQSRNDSQQMGNTSETIYQKLQ